MDEDNIDVKILRFFFSYFLNLVSQKSLFPINYVKESNRVIPIIWVLEYFENRSIFLHRINAYILLNIIN